MADREHLVIDQTTFIAYVAIVLAFVFIPGPATLLTMARATTSGTRVDIATGLGSAIGDIIHMAMAVFGISAIIYASAFLFGLIKYLGAGYLIYLGICAIRAPVQSDFKPQAARISSAAAFRQAILAELLNPKTALFFLALLPQFVRPENGLVLLQLAIFGIILTGLGLLSTVIFAVFSGGIGTLLQRSSFVSRWQGKVVGSIYCALGLRLAFQER